MLVKDYNATFAALGTVSEDLASNRLSLRHPGPQRQLHLPDDRTPAGCQGATKRILIADGDVLLRDMLAASLEDAGYQVKTAKDGEAAWAELLARCYDLLVTDDIMPKTSGLALVRRIRVASMALFVVLVSDRLDAVDVAKLNHDPWARFDAFVCKPFTMSEMLTVVQRVLAAV
jgi:DNA-binding response OmpR family regulator